MKSKSLRIGNIEITFVLPDKNWLKIIDKNYSSFILNKPSSIKVTISHNFKRNKETNPQVNHKNNKIEIIRSDFKSVSSNNLTDTSLSIECNKYSFDSWLRVFVSMLALKNKGLLIHASSINYRNFGFIFAGVSGSGKSTIIKKIGENYALSDEISYLFYKNSTLCCASTPFWGELKKPKHQKSDILRVKTLFFLKHADELSKIKLTKVSAFKEIMKTILFFSSDPKNNYKLIKLAESISETQSFMLKFRLKDSKSKILEAIC